MGNKKVLWFQVTVHNVVRMQIPQAADQMLKEMPCLCLCESPSSLRPQKLVELPFRTVFKEQVDSVGILEVLVESKHVLMFHLLLKLNLTFDLVNQLTIDYLKLLHRFQRVHNVCALTTYSANNSERAFPEGSAASSVEDLEVRQLNVRARRRRAWRGSRLGAVC